jgi:hypothetical protein
MSASPSLLHRMAAVAPLIALCRELRRGLGLNGRDRPHYAIGLVHIFRVKRGSTQQPLQIVHHQFLFAGARAASPAAALIGPLVYFFGCGLKHRRGLLRRKRLR